MEDAQKPEIRPEIGLGDVWHAAWRSLRTTQATVGLLMALAVASVVGVLVPQGASLEEYTAKLGKAFGPLVVRLGLDHIFSSWWYLLLITLVVLSAAACARRIWRLGRDLAAGPPLALLSRKLGATDTVKLSRPSAGVLAEVTRAFRRHGYRVSAESDKSGASYVVAHKHGWAAYGLVLSHVAIFSLALGALIGVWPGANLEKSVNITEGQVYTDPDHSFPFALRLNSFALEYYPDQTTVKAYKSNVSVLEGDREVTRQTVLVNHPLSYGGLQFYQSSYGIGGFSLKVTPPGGQVQELTFPLEQTDSSTYAIPEGGAVQFVGEKQAAIVARDFSVGGSGGACPRPDAPKTDAPKAGANTPDPSCPSANLTLVSGFGHGSDHAFKDLGWLQPGTPVQAEGYTLELQPVHYYTGLIARRDYGVPFVWTGFALLVLGLIVTFYFKPHALAAGVTPTGSGAKLAVAMFAKGGAGEERWQTQPYPVVGQILTELTEQSAAPTGPAPQRREEDDS